MFLFFCVNIVYVLPILKINYVAYEQYGIWTVLHITDQSKSQTRILLYVAIVLLGAITWSVMF